MNSYFKFFFSIYPPMETNLNFESFLQILQIKLKSETETLIVINVFWML